MYIKKGISIILFAISVISTILSFVNNDLTWALFITLIAFILGMFIWPNKMTYCQKCGKKYDTDTEKLLTKAKRIVESKKENKCYYTYKLSHTCHCNSCNNTYVYSEERKGGYKVFDKEGNLILDKSIPLEK